MSQLKIKQKCKGFTLVEVLVTVVILAIGLLGLSGLQTTALKNNLNSEFTGKAAQLVYDMSDRMRSNIENRSNVAALNSYLNAATTHNNCTTAVGCTFTEQAEQDKFEWQTDISNALPFGQGSISVSAGVYSIMVQWDDNKNGAIDASDASFAIRFLP